MVAGDNESNSRIAANMVAIAFRNLQDECQLSDMLFGES
jgi:hypothetical protein